jgi:hypothetical protein
MLNEFPHRAPINYTYEFENWNSSTVRIMMSCSRKFDYNLGARTKTVWGFYKPKKRLYYAPINAKTIGKQVDIDDTSPYSAMPLNKTALEKAFL